MNVTKSLLALFTISFLFLPMSAHAERMSREEMIKKYDSNKDGRLSKDEIEVFRKEMQKTRPKPPSKDKPKPIRVDQSFIKPEVFELPDSVFQKTTSIKQKYLFFSQQTLKKGKQAPLIIYLHGSGGHKRDIQTYQNTRLGGLISENKYPFTLAIPQFKPNSGVANGWKPSDLDLFLDHLISNHQVDAKNIFVTGHSMGGAGTFMWANSSASSLTAICPSAAGGATEPKGELPIQAENFKYLPVWAFHGSADPVCDPVRISNFVDEINSLGGNAKMMIYEGKSHNINIFADANNNPLKWFLSHLR